MSGAKVEKMTQADVDMFALTARLRRQQYRQDLHDQKYHTDIYVLPKPQRLNHLVLHHMKYVSDLHKVLRRMTIAGEVREEDHELLKRRCLDGLIVCLSMANICGKHLITSLATFPWHKEGATDAMIEAVGTMAKTIEDIDHMGQTNPLGEIFGMVNVLLGVYTGALSLVGIEFQDIVEHIDERLLQVESKHMWHDRYLEMIIYWMARYDAAPEKTDPFHTPRV